MTDKQIKLDGRFIPKEVAIRAGLIRLDRIDKMEIDLANYEQMVRDIEKIIEPYQLNLELDCLSLPNAIQSILERKEQENKDLREDIKDIANLLDLDTGEEYNFGNIELEIKELKAENEELNKEREKKRDHYFIISNENARLEDEKARLGYGLNCKIEKLKQTLAEIKEIITTALKQNTLINLDKILQKINEVENEKV